MTKQHLIALADKLRTLKPRMDAKTSGQNDLYLDGRMAQWEVMRDALGDLCLAQNPRFKRDRWLAYIAGEVGQNGGSIKRGKEKGGMFGDGR